MFGNYLVDKPMRRLSEQLRLIINKRALWRRRSSYLLPLAVVAAIMIGTGIATATATGVTQSRA
jgi:hypothetical protein